MKFNSPMFNWSCSADIIAVLVLLRQPHKHNERERDFRLNKGDTKVHVHSF